MRPAPRQPIKRGGGAPRPAQPILQLQLDLQATRPERRIFVPDGADLALSARARVVTRKRAPPPPPPPPEPKRPLTVFWRWIWKEQLPERVGQRFHVRSMLRATKQVMIEFDDGDRVITGMNSLVRRWS